MIINQHYLFKVPPLEPMAYDKMTGHGVSWGMSEAGYDIRIKQDVLLHPFKRFSLASTMERFHMPDNMVAIVHDKSSWARRGLSVFNTVIEPGWQGYLTLELVYHGWRPLKIPSGSGIAQVIFHEIMAPIAYRGKYQNQANKPVSAIRS